MYLPISLEIGESTLENSNENLEISLKDHTDEPSSHTVEDKYVDIQIIYMTNGSIPNAINGNEEKDIGERMNV